MQRASTPLLTAFSKTSLNKSDMKKLTVTLLTASILSLTGCQTFKNLTGKDDSAIATAERSEAGYYQEALEAMDKGHYMHASEQLSELRTFYPTGQYAEQALLDLMYSQFNNKEYELAATSAEQFIKLYPRNIQVDYAYYVRGVANMQAGHSALLNMARLNQAHRDTSYMRLAFSNFQELISRYPNSSYAPDAAKRMSYIYNQFAESELAVARWYIKRDAYVAAVNRAKWVFQYYPLSQGVPEAIAILAYANDQLGLTDLSKEYKTLLQINYPEWLTGDGQVKMNLKRSSGLLNMITFGKLGRSQDDTSTVTPTEYNGATKTQVVRQAAQMSLPEEGAPSQSSMPSISTNRRGINLGLGLPPNPGAQYNAPQPDSDISNSQNLYPQTNQRPRNMPANNSSLAPVNDPNNISTPADELP